MVKKIYTCLIMLVVASFLSSCSVSPRELACDYTGTSVVGDVSGLVYCTEFEQAVLGEAAEYTLDSTEIKSITETAKSFMKYTYRAGYAFSSVSDIENEKEYMSADLYECSAVREYLTDFVKQIIEYKANANIESFTISNKALSFKNGEVLRVDVSTVYEITSQYNTNFPEKVRSGLYNGDNFYGFSFYVVNSGDSYKIAAWSEYSYDFTKLTLFTSEGVEVLQEAVEPDNSNMYDFN